MPLTTDEANALRHCARILAPYYTSERRGVMISGVEDFIQRGKWPRWYMKDIARLFYPHDREQEAHMESLMLAAMEAKELSGIGESVGATDLAAWISCPPVPKNSPLRFWLPEFMHETDLPVKKSSAEKNLQTNWKMLIQEQAAILWREYKKMDCSPTKNSIKAELAKWCRENNVATKTGINPSEDYISRHVLRKWTPPTG